MSFFCYGKVLFKQFSSFFFQVYYTIKLACTSQKSKILSSNFSFRTRSMYVGIALAVMGVILTTFMQAIAIYGNLAVSNGDV
jgi:uncharacterized membrane protein